LRRILGNRARRPFRRSLLVNPQQQSLVPALPSANEN
jgi:hypothetical protein